MTLSKSHIKRIPMTYSNQDYAVVVNSLKGKLPSLPVILNELMTIVSDHDATLHAIRDLLRLDPAISTLLLKVANTTEFRQGSAERISSIEDALTRLGLDEVKKLALKRLDPRIVRIDQRTRRLQPESPVEAQCGSRCRELKFGRKTHFHAAGFGVYLRIDP